MAASRQDPYGASRPQVGKGKEKLILSCPRGGSFVDDMLMICLGLVFPMNDSTSLEMLTLETSLCQQCENPANKEARRQATTRFRHCLEHYHKKPVCFLHFFYTRQAEVPMDFTAKSLALQESWLAKVPPWPELSTSATDVASLVAKPRPRSGEAKLFSVAVLVGRR